MDAHDPDGRGIGMTAGLGFAIGGLTAVYALPAGSPSFVTATLCGLLGAFSAGRASARGREADRPSLNRSATTAAAGAAVAAAVAIALLSASAVPVPRWAVDGLLAALFAWAILRVWQ